MAEEKKSASLKSNDHIRSIFKPPVTQSTKPETSKNLGTCRDGRVFRRQNPFHYSRGRKQGCQAQTQTVTTPHYAMCAIIRKRNSSETSPLLSISVVTVERCTMKSNCIKVVAEAISQSHISISQYYELLVTITSDPPWLSYPVWS